jgi:CHAT domain
LSAYEFQIRISKTMVHGWAADSARDEDLQPMGEATLQVDKVLLESTRLLEQWLNCWELINRAKWKRPELVLQPHTFKVLGKLLWRLVLSNPDGDDNPVGKNLKNALRANKASSMRVTIMFEADADPVLRGLPWEFLYRNDDGLDHFLATETNLLLTRYVPPTDGDRIFVTPAKGKLRVQFIAALPRFDRFSTDILDFQALHESVKEATKNVGLEVLKPIAGWDAEAVRAALTGSTCHIVHVVGLCRGTPDEPKIFLGSPGDGWDDPKPLVDALTPDHAARPQLVILQLCDDEDGDASENFERLAPALIAEGVPAVLAMQYAYSAADGGVGPEFYDLLCNGKTIGEAVQQSRHNLYDGKQLNRRFGTPVLYLQGDGPLILRTERPIPTGGVRRPKQAGAVNNQTIRTSMAAAIEDPRVMQLLEPEARLPLYRWVTTLPLTDDVAYARKEVNLRLTERIGPGDRQAFRVMLENLGKLQGGPSDAPTRTA